MKRKEERDLSSEELAYSVLISPIEQLRKRSNEMRHWSKLRFLGFCFVVALVVVSCAPVQPTAAPTVPPAPTTAPAAPTAAPAVPTSPPAPTAAAATRLQPPLPQRRPPRLRQPLERSTRFPAIARWSARDGMSTTRSRVPPTSIPIPAHSCTCATFSTTRCWRISSSPTMQPARSSRGKGRVGSTTATIPS